jgi:lipid A 4'-phosphatase
MSAAVGTVVNAGNRWRGVALGSCLPIVALGGAALVAFPDIDLAISRAMYSSSAGFVGSQLGWIGALRTGFIVFYFGCIAVAIAGWVAARRGHANLPSARQWLFLMACLGVGPGLVANLVFKEQWGRARPGHVMAFGGHKQFTPPLVPTNQCRRNCSFISGEAASVFVPFYAAAAIAPQWAATLIIAGTAGGLAAGMVRVAQGAHFFSDVIFAGIFMGLVVVWLQRLLLTTEKTSAGALHERGPALERP